MVFQIFLEKQCYYYYIYNVYSEWKNCLEDEERENLQNHDEPNYSGYFENNEIFLNDLRISSPVPTFSNVPWSRSQEYSATIEG